MDLSRATWRKASRSTNNGGNCVELAAVPGSVAVRDSKNPHGGELLLDHADFRRFVGVIKDL
ncbi:DUF397 domain-containing protein [Actinomadura parmotrematis]|uniref:DUF397 domain-containing protein n=1 Tax=Actinomadura parmotrematis TaxID=2864039 RepID=A0ABS7FVV4_9ACTN|nr:DUF397 domain-containing protein [Actinomadura parmotrematis]MBW8484564.1 DUF397 domain-containing protein [Actinomadura parmotrematis]